MKKTLNIIKEVVIWIIAILAIGMVIFTMISCLNFDRTDKNFLGYKFFVVRSDSMAATDFKAGDLIYSKTVDPSTLKEGDVITFISQNDESFGETVTHKIRSLTTDAEGNPGFITYGTTTNTDDAGIVTYPYVVGKYQGKISGVGNFFIFLKTTPGYIVCIFVPFLILILYCGIRTIRDFRQYKSEQTSELKEERKKIEAEKMESAELLKQLKELQAQLANQQGGGSAGPLSQNVEKKDVQEPGNQSDLKG